MTKKDYTKIAAAAAVVVNDEERRRLVNCLHAVFAEDNPRYNAKLFAQAVENEKRENENGGGVEW